MEKTERKQTRDQITQMTRYQILSGAMKPREELTQEGIVEQLELSRISVRGVLQSLGQEELLVRLPNRHMQISVLVVEDVNHIFRVIAVMVTELFALVPANRGELLRAHAQKLARVGDNVGKLVFRQLLTSYFDNRYLARVYQQFLNSYTSCVILYLKEDGQEPAQIPSELTSATGHGEGEKITQVTQRYFPMLAGIARQHMKDWESAEA